MLQMKKLVLLADSINLSLILICAKYRILHEENHWSIILFCVVSSPTDLPPKLPFIFSGIPTTVIKFVNLSTGLCSVDVSAKLHWSLRTLHSSKSPLLNYRYTN